MGCVDLLADGKGANWVNWSHTRLQATQTQTAPSTIHGLVLTQQFRAGNASSGLTQLQEGDVMCVGR